ncbi:MAG: AAA family ATPase [Thermoguttaceae bacterium]
MFKALELAGFKSFADRTRFEFPPGITVVVGPNGSGKSNIVDSIKWVLGEQSVKSLRGREMADVIFNGSPTRRGMNSAEITLTFDNSKHLLAIDAPEVHITRRVYRSGEGEYLINRNPCRLRDIRDLLSGTGLGTQAYSVIEQGKVDVLLQSSARDRRVIFEEAAGISRFKLKKIEALRRLERVDQNLLRLADIVDEVDSRLRGVRAQAGKARRYREYTDRLQELRTQVGLVDWRRLSARLAEFDGAVRTLAAQRDAAAAEAEASEARLLEVDLESSQLTEAVRRSEAQIAGYRERIAARESAIEHQRNRGRDLEQEIARLRRQVLSLSVRADDFEQQWQDTVAAVQAAEEHHGTVAQRMVEGQRTLTALVARLDEHRRENEQRRSAYLEQMRLAAVVGNEIGGLESESSATAAAQQKSLAHKSELDGQIAALAADLEQLRTQREQLARSVDRQEEGLAAAKEQLAQRQRQRAARQEDLAELRQRHSAAAERAAVLEELQRRQEGLSAGVKEVLAQAAAGNSGPLAAVLGLVADLFQVSVETAPLVEVALGQAAQHVVALPERELLDFLRDHSQRFAGRVGFLWLDEQAPASSPPGADLEGRPGVLGRADRFIETQPRFVPLAARLLGQTWIVEKLAHALELARGLSQFSFGDRLRSQENGTVPFASATAIPAPGLRFVTLAGELLEADGTLVVGPRQAVTGLISRRSQLRALQNQLLELQARIDQGQAEIDRLFFEIGHHQEQVQCSTAEHRQAADALAEHRLKIGAVEERRAQFIRQRTALDAELRAAAEEHDEALTKLSAARARRTQLETALADMESDLSTLNERMARLEAQRQAGDRETTETKVELAKSEERLRSLRAHLRQFEAGRQERGRAIADGRQQLAETIARAEAAQWSVLGAESEIAELYLCKEVLAAAAVEQNSQRESLQRQRVELTAESQRVRGRIRKVEEAIHGQELAATEVRHQRDDLAARLREDYGIELAELEHEPSGEEQLQRTEVQQEIDELRQKINNLGNVNLEALEELDNLESRHKTLSDQHHDLVSAKTSLEKIIEKINADSRRLFAETLETVKGHFQKLFRDLFGGGHGDIVLEEGVDILESGIEIVARPPGKEPRSISLLSGGEKTLTCVALLLAIFRSKPSPFCVLDEVDAALDEANIDRFTKVLRDFLAWTQFVIVTHSKKTMTCATTIYGVTMQESGVSKQVSVRFEDVSDDGHILPERLEAAKQEPQAA